MAVRTRQLRSSERAKLVAQRLTAEAQARREDQALSSEPAHLRDQRPQTFGVWLTTLEACDYLRYTGKHRLRALYRFIERKGIKTYTRSRRALLISRVDLDQAIRAGRGR